MGYKTADMVIEDLEKLEIPLGESAIRGYASKELISPAKPGGGRGRRTLYHSDAAVEAAASRYLIENHRMPFSVVAQARKIALYLEAASGPLPSAKTLKNDRELARLLRGDVLVALMAGEWLRVKLDTQERLLETESLMEERAREEDGRYRRAKAMGLGGAAGEAFGTKTRLKQEIARRYHLRNLAPDLVRIAMGGPVKEAM